MKEVGPGEVRGRGFRTIATGLAALGVMLGAGCSKPEPPTLKPRAAEITNVDLLGVDVMMTIDAHNPNRIPLAVQKVSAHVVLDAAPGAPGAHDLGQVAIEQPFTLPANADTTLRIPIALRWNAAGTLGAIAAGRRDVPFTVTGTATVGGERLNVDVPFSLSGTISQAQIVSAATRGLERLPSLLPGLVPSGMIPAPIAPPLSP